MNGWKNKKLLKINTLLKYKMEKQFTRIDVYKLTVLELAKHHRKNCDGQDCVISLFILREMAEKLGVKFNEEEIKEFI